MSDKKVESCGWQGLGFGAHYEDAGCVMGMASDLDNCEGSMVFVGEELCPQCKGTGVPVDGERGVMALHRQRERDELQDLLDEIKDEDLQELIVEHVDGMHKLIRGLEETVKS